MARIVIDLDPDQKAWLDHQAALRGVARQQALARSAGIWRGEDGLDYQRRLRAEWR